MPRFPLRVLVVEDSAVVRALLTHVIEGDPRLKVAAQVASAEEAIARLDEIAPDIISMDINLPGMNGLEATRRIMSERPTPIVVISGATGGRELSSSMDALRAGALSVVEKPVGVTGADYRAVAAEIRTQLVIMSEVPVVRRRLREVPPAAVARHAPAVSPPRLVVCAASTGGPQALARLLGQLPSDWPLPILLVQHMGAAFLEGFARWLDSVVPLDVRLATHRQMPRPGTVHVAPGGRHLRLRGERLLLEDDEPIRGQRPAATALFESAADAFGSAALGVVLTGMGEDGAPGVERLVAAGAPVLAESEASAVVYGMPAAAVRAGAEPVALDLLASEMARIARVPVRA